MTKYNCAIVTGASSGIGAAITMRMCMNGTKVYAIARSVADLSALKKTLNKQHQNNLVLINCDVSSRTQVDRAFRNIMKLDSIDLVVSNAGVGVHKRFIDHSQVDINKVLNTNLSGNINVIKATLKYKKEHFVQIVCTSSLAGKIGFSEMSIYSATKFALEGMIESLRNEYNPKDVLFTIFRPGITGTPFFKKADMQDFEDSVKNSKSFYAADKVAEILLTKLNHNATTIIVGNDKFFLRLLPFIPFKFRFKILDIINKI